MPCCVWRISTELVVALDGRFGEPVDAYVNGAQTWLREDGPNAEVLEWRLHPVAGFRRPEALGTHELFASIALAVGTGAVPPAEPDALWGGLEAFPANDEGAELEPMRLAEACTTALGLAPDASGLVDHEPIASAWEQAGGAHSIMDALFAQLGG